MKLFCQCYTLRTNFFFKLWVCFKKMFKIAKLKKKKKKNGLSSIWKFRLVIIFFLSLKSNSKKKMSGSRQMLILNVTHSFLTFPKLCSSTFVRMICWCVYIAVINKHDFSYQSHRNNFVFLLPCICLLPHNYQ